MKIEKGVKIHFIGIGGASMSALARFAFLCGAIVSGSDRVFAQSLHELDKIGIEVYAFDGQSGITSSKRVTPDTEHFADNVEIFPSAKFVERADLIVYSSAVPESDFELTLARNLNKTVYDRAEFLGLIAENFSRVIAVGGTHGKTTVTAMIIHALLNLDANFVGHVGGDTAYGNLVKHGTDGDIFVTEACEYKKNLLQIKPQIGIVLNVECDHPDCYPELSDVKAVFRQFLAGCDTAIVDVKNLDICPYADMFGLEFENTLSDAQKRADGVVVGVFSYAQTNIYSYQDMGEETRKKCGSGETVALIGNSNIEEKSPNGSDDGFQSAMRSDKMKCTRKLSKKTDKDNVDDSTSVNVDDSTSVNVVPFAGANSKAKMKAQTKTIANSSVNTSAEANRICIYKNGKEVARLTPPLDGRHNRDNLLFALVAIDALGIDIAEAADALSSFGGVKRRYERAGQLKGVPVVFDYAHHPTQIKNVLSVAQNEGRVLTVFQPHTYSRTAKYMADFVRVLSGCDTLILAPTYAAREQCGDKADSAELRRQILSNCAQNRVYLAKNLQSTFDFAKRLACGFDLVLVLGAGDIYDFILDRL